jgi:triphosphatase
MADAGKALPEPREVELKLELDPADMIVVESHPLLAGAPRERQTLISVYYDTDDLALQKAGVCLRVRDTGKGYVQTIKTMNGPAQLFDRPEWEHAVSGREPDLSLAAGTPLEPLLDDKVRGGLKPQFQTRIERAAYHLAKDGAEIEVAIDRGEIDAPKRWLPVHEVELELKRGSPAALFHLARGLAATVPLRLAVKTKAERGYELADNIALAAEKATHVALDAGMSCQHAFRVIGQSCLRQIVVNEQLVRAGEAQGLHQMRIGLRRLRAAIAAFAKMVDDTDRERIKGELKWITNELGPARDLDVFEADVLKSMDGTHDDSALNETRRVFATSRAKVYAGAIAAISSDRFRIGLLDAAEWIDTGAWTIEQELSPRRERPLKGPAAKLLAKLRKQIKEEGKDLRQLDVESRHKLRIKAKNFRYAVEFFAHIFAGEEIAKRREAALTALKAMQESLGALNDRAMREALIASGHEFGNHAADLLSSRVGEVDDLLDRAEAAHADFAKLKPFWH